MGGRLTTETEGLMWHAPGANLVICNVEVADHLGDERQVGECVGEGEGDYAIDRGKRIGILR